jgi:hypothetical protein
MSDQHARSSPAPTPALSSRLLRLWRGFSRLADLCAHHFNGDLRASLFSAALAVLALKIGALTILTKLSLLVVSNQALVSAPQVPLAGSGPLVLYLSENQWQQRYLERSPLDRCKLAEDLGALLARGPRQLLVDFDLSPAAQEAQSSCQRQLDALLDQHAQQLVLLMPYRVASDVLLAQKAAWLAARCQAGVAFGDGGLNVSLGAVLDYVPESDAMADAMHERAQAGACAQLASAAGAERWLRRGADPEMNDGAAEAINFSGFSKQVVALALDDPAVDDIRNWGERQVYLGGDYGGSKDDRFLTPMGALPGVAIHAAIAWTQAHPVRELPHALGMLVDVVTAFVFSLGIGFFWLRYLKLSWYGRGFARENSTLLVIGFVGYFLAMLWLFFQLSVLLFAYGILIAPMLIGLTMLIDGFVRGPIGASLELRATTSTQERAAAALMPAQVMPVLCTGLIVCVLLKLLHHGPAPLVLVGVTLLAALLDRVLPVLWPAADSAHAHAGQDAYPYWYLLGWIVPVLLLAVLADHYAASGVGGLLSGFIGLIAGLLLVLCTGLLRALRWRRFQRPERWFSASLLGIQQPLQGWRDVPGILAFAVRHIVYWVVLVAALQLILSHS